MADDPAEFELLVMAGLVRPSTSLVRRKTWMPASRHDVEREPYSAARLAAFVNFFITRSRFSFDR